MVTPFCFQQSNPKSGKISGPSNHSPKDSKPKCLPSPNHTRGWNFPLGCSSVDISLRRSLHLGRSKRTAAPRKNSTEFSHEGNEWLVPIRTGLAHTSCFLVNQDANTGCSAPASVLWWPLGISCWEHPSLLVKVAGSSVPWLLCSSLPSHWLCS